jgi:predicted glycosyltransferase involved in capsule biosynthesis
MHTDKKLTVILPIRVSQDRLDAIDRIGFVRQDISVPENVDFLVVDDGSSQEFSIKIQEKCEELGIQYQRIDSSWDVFSIGRARNLGVQVARTPHVMFQDIDLLPYPGFYQSVLHEIEVQQLDNFADRFLMFGVIYLTQEATKEFFQVEAHKRKSLFTQYLLENNVRKIEKFSTGTSVTVWNRHYFLASGGNDADFEGWGYEDLEFACRAIRRAKRFPLPEEFGLDYRNFQTISEFRGWKSIYRLFGDITFQKGMVLFHGWHPVEQDGNYIKAKDRNRKLFEKKLTEFKELGIEPPPLPMPERGKTVIFRKNPWVDNRWIAPLLGEVVYLDEDEFLPETLIAFAKENNVTRILFHNPFANEKMIGIYSAVKESALEYIVCERGALPSSVFFDASGFNGESDSYNERHWRFELSQIQIDNIELYIREIKASNETLESQPNRLGANGFRRKIGVGSYKKILFVPLQRPSDTVIKYFSGQIEGYENFLVMLRRLLYTLPNDWCIVAKRHPLETESPDLPGVIYADDFHINDLLTASDAILAINSGVGLLGLIFEKPVLTCGLAFYCHAGVAAHVKDHDDVVKELRHPTFDRGTRLQFLHYLVFKFYSFADFKTRTVKWQDNSLMTATTSIDYKILRFPGLPGVNLERRAQAEISDNSILFDRYRDWDRSIRRTRRNSGVPIASQAKVLAAGVLKKSGGLQVLSTDLTVIKHSNGSSPLWLRRLNKLKNNPVMYLRDSKFRILRSVGWSIKKD